MQCNHDDYLADDKADEDASTTNKHTISKDDIVLDHYASLVLKTQRDQLGNIRYEIRRVNK